MNPRTKVNSVAHAKFIEARVKMVQNERESSLYSMAYDSNGAWQK